MALDINKWLVDEMGFSAAEATELAPKFTGERLTKLENGFLRQQDYSKHMNDLQAAKDELATANERVNAEMAEFATIQANEGKITKKMRQDLDAAQQQALKLQQRVRDLAIAAGQDPTKALEGIEATVVPQNNNQPPSNAPDLTGYVKSDDLSATLGNMLSFSVQLPATLLTLDREHHKLTGESLDAQRVIDELNNRSQHNAKTKNAAQHKSLDPRQIWEDLYEVPKLRQAAEEKRVSTLVAEAEKRGREAALSEGAIPGSHTPEGRHAPVFTQERKSKLERPQPGTTSQAAASAFRSGKYRQPAAGAGSKSA